MITLYLLIETARKLIELLPKIRFFGTDMKVGF